MRILVIFPGALGDLICVGPALREIGRRFPTADVDLMARAELARLAVGRLGVAKGYSIDRREVISLFLAGSAADPAARDLFGRFDRIFSFFAADDANFRQALTACTSGEVSFHPFRPPGTGHISRRYLQSIGSSAEHLESRLELSDSDLASADSVLADANVSPGQFLLIFPGSGSPAKNWAVARFARVGAEMSRSLKPLVVTGPAESEIDEMFHSSRITLLSGLDLATVAALSRRSAVFVGNDSGVSHLAAAAGARGVVIFGPSDPDDWMPLGQITVVRRMPLEALQPGEVLNILRSRLVS